MDEVLLIKPKRHQDDRGHFSETYNRLDLLEQGLDVDFVQDNHSLSYTAGTLRGLHFQAPPHGQGKLIRCGRGAFFDVAVDIRHGSPNFGKWQGYKLTSENGHQLYVPIGFAHGLVTLEPNTEVIYKCTDYYKPGSEGSIYWNSFGIDWPIQNQLILSDKDQKAPRLNEFLSPFVLGENC